MSETRKIAAILVSDVGLAPLRDFGGEIPWHCREAFDGHEFPDLPRDQCLKRRRARVLRPRKKGRYSTRKSQAQRDLRPICSLQLLHDPADMNFHGAFAQPQLIRYYFVGFAYL